MGYSHGRKWNDESIKKAIIEVMDVAKINTFPTRSVMKEITGNEGLSNAISKHGGFRKWAERLGVEIKSCESEYGREYEVKCVSTIIYTLNCKCEYTPPRYPYDVLVENNTKIDVKVGRLHQNKTGRYYTFNLEKSKPTCDIFVCYCVDGKKDNTVYVIPSCVLSGKTQLTIGETTSKYDIYVDYWELIDAYRKFYSRMLN